MSAPSQYFIATLADGQGYALLDGNKVLNTHAAIAEAVKARIELVDVDKRESRGHPERA